MGTPIFILQSIHQGSYFACYVISILLCLYMPGQIKMLRIFETLLGYSSFQRVLNSITYIPATWMATSWNIYRNLAFSNFYKNPLRRKDSSGHNSFCPGDYWPLKRTVNSARGFTQSQLSPPTLSANLGKVQSWTCWRRWFISVWKECQHQLYKRSLSSHP